MIAGFALLLGEAGVLPVMLGVVGAIESCRYVSGLEHKDTLAARSVAVARIFVVVFVATVTPMPGLANAAAVPVAMGDPVQSDVV